MLVASSRGENFAPCAMSKPAKTPPITTDVMIGAWLRAA